MASTNETAIVWAITLMAISGVATMVNVMGPPGVPFLAIENSVFQGYFITADDIIPVQEAFQQGPVKSSDQKDTNVFAFIDIGIAMFGLLTKAILNVMFGWLLLVSVAVFQTGVPTELGLLIAGAIAFPIFMIELIGLAEIAFLIKRLIPFI